MKHYCVVLLLNCHFPSYFSGQGKRINIKTVQSLDGSHIIVVNIISPAIAPQKSFEIEIRPEDNNHETL